MVDADMVAAGLRTFFRITARWKLTDEEQLGLLGLRALSTLVALKAGAPPPLSRDMLERVSYVLGIFKAINTLLPVPERADGWIRAPNAAPVFGGAAPIARMAAGSVSDLYVVRQHLDCQLV
jgi:hypothetical protein